jgi:hypothetical protein
VKARVIRGGKIRRSTGAQPFRAIRKSTVSSREKFAAIWELKNHEIRTRNGERTQYHDVPAAADRFVQRVFEEIKRWRIF